MSPCSFFPNKCVCDWLLLVSLLSPFAKAMSSFVLYVFISELGLIATFPCGDPQQSFLPWIFQSSFLPCGGRPNGTFGHILEPSFPSFSRFSSCRLTLLQNFLLPPTAGGCSLYSPCVPAFNPSGFCLQNEELPSAKEPALPPLPAERASFAHNSFSPRAPPHQYRQFAPDCFGKTFFFSPPLRQNGCLLATFLSITHPFPSTSSSEDPPCFPSHPPFFSRQYDRGGTKC